MLYELDELEDITDIIVFEDDPYIFTEESAIELVETVLILMDELMIHYDTIPDQNLYDIL